MFWKRYHECRSAEIQKYQTSIFYAALNITALVIMLPNILNKMWILRFGYGRITDKDRRDMNMDVNTPIAEDIRITV